MKLTRLIQTLFALLLLLMVQACANIGRPSGGPRDYDPPVFLRSTPLPNALHVKKNKIELEFDEIVLVEKIAEKVIISPPQREMPIIRPSGRKVQIEINDTLLPDMTYVIDFADAIVDNNEKNPLPNFAFAFSTGAHVDTMELSGWLLNAADLEPITGMMVGLTQDHSDSTFTKVPFVKITQSDAYGRFTVKHIADTTYRVFGLKDINRSYTFDLPNEAIAFSDSTYRPIPYPVEMSDTLYTRAGVMDTVVHYTDYRYKPDNILLLSFEEESVMRYLDKSERRQRNKLSMLFSAPADSLPRLEPLNFESTDWVRTERNLRNDSIHYWIVDSVVAKMDTLLFAVDYLRTDSTRAMTMHHDTLRFTFRDAPPPKASAKKRREEQEAKPQKQFFTFSSKFSGTIDIFESGVLTFEQPIDSFSLESFRLELMVDTLWQPTEFSLIQDTLTHRRLQLQKKWEPSAEYRLSIDSAAIQSSFGLHNNAFEQRFKVKAIEEYAGLFLTMVGIADSTAAFVELLDKSDKPVRREPVVDGVAEFFYLRPETYYARVVVDLNGDGVWSTGKFAEGRQPEPLYYYPGSFQLRQNWDVEQRWDILERPITQQKPKEITKNKPKEVDPVADQERDRQQGNQGNSNSFNNFGTPNNSNNSFVNPGQR